MGWSASISDSWSGMSPVRAITRARTRCADPRVQAGVVGSTSGLTILIRVRQQILSVLNRLQPAEKLVESVGTEDDLGMAPVRWREHQMAAYWWVVRPLSPLICSARAMSNTDLRGHSTTVPSVKVSRTGNDSSECLMVGI